MSATLGTSAVDDRAEAEGTDEAGTVASEWCRHLRFDLRGVVQPLPPRFTHCMAFTRDSFVVLSDEQVSTSLGDETVILGMRDGVYYGLDAVGARVWALVASPRRVSDLVQAITREFDVAPERCEEDLLALLEELSARELVREVAVEGDADLS